MRNRKLLWLVAALFFAQLALAQTHTYELDWKNPNAAYPLCSSSLNTWCDYSMTVFEQVGTVNTVLSSSLNPLATSYVFPVFPTAGNHTYGVVENYKDLTGTIMSTGAAIATLNVPNLNGVPPAAITGLVGVAR